MKLRLGGFERVHRDALERLVRERAVDRIWAGDATLWKKDEAHRKVIENALGWLTSAERMQADLPGLASFAEEVSREADHVVVLGMGGSSLAPLVFSLSFPRASGRPALEVLDSTDPAMVLDVAGRCDPARTFFVVSSKSGTTLEPNILFDYFFDCASRSLPGRAGERFAVITDPGSALEREAAARRVRRVFPGDPRIGGRYSALSHFGLVPAAILGVDVAELLARARKMAELCRRDAPGNPGAILGAAMAALAMKGRDKLTFSMGRPVERFGLWIEQLVAESTGKEETGILPVEGEPLGSPADYGADRFFVRIDREGRGTAEPRERLAALSAAGHPAAHYELDDALDLGAEMFRWEFATAVAGALLGIDAFDQPNVQEAKDRTNEILAGKSPDAGVGQAPAPDAQAVKALLDGIGPGDYFAITAYVPSTPGNEERLGQTRLRVRDGKKVATTVGFGPRFQHSTGQFHKGGPPTGVFLQLTAGSPAAVPIPGRPYGFERVIEAQAAGDRMALASRGRRVLSVEIGPDLERGLDDLDAAVAAALGSR
ncbi:MAG: glucose-6-phosphate isomerase [Acidobacteriota bacterium]